MIFRYSGFHRKVTSLISSILRRFANRCKIDFRELRQSCSYHVNFFLYRARSRYKALHRVLCKTRDALNVSDKHYAITNIVQLIAYQIERHSLERVLAYLDTGVCTWDNDLLVIIFAISLNPSLDWERRGFYERYYCLMIIYAHCLLSLLRVAWREYLGLPRKIFDYNVLYTNLFLSFYCRNSETL